MRTQMLVLVSSIAVLWAVFATDRVLGGALIAYGVHPRSVDGLWEIFTAPFLHGSFDHLAANTIPFLILGWLVMLRDPRHFFAVALVAAIGAGLVAWTFGAPNSVHIGASGVVFGFFGFLVFAGWYTRSLMSIAQSILVIGLWGGLVLGVLPGQPGISWQAHLGGFVGGALSARWFARGLPSMRSLRR